MKRGGILAALLAGLLAGLAAAGWLLRDRLRARDGTTTPISTGAPPIDPSLTDVSGIGPVYERRLVDAGIASLGELVEAGAARIADVTGVTEAAAAFWIEQAVALQGTR